MLGGAPAATILSVIVAWFDVPDALLAVTEIALFVAMAVGVPVIRPLESMDNPNAPRLGALKLVGEFVAATCTGVIAVPTVPETEALLTTGGTLLGAAAMFRVMVAGADVPKAFVAVTLTDAFVAALVGVPVIRPVDAIESP
jgi:hypothetical protein